FGGGHAQQPRMRYSGGGQPDLEDLLGGMFGGGAGGFNGGYGPQPGRDLAANARLTFRQAVSGDTLSLTVSGRSTKVRLPAGIKDGQKIKVPGKGEPGQGGGPAGALVVTVSVEPHPVFAIGERANLTMTVPVTFPEAVSGATISIPTLDGESVKLKVPAGTRSGSRLRVKGKGIQTKTRTGDLIVTVEVAVPRNLSDAARSALQQFQEATAADDPRVGLAESARV
ncbi:MAG: DnaJ C-terminal domain-containing protein, partial [Beutenbergiaceae bacterium]